jgi:hypothetical protein
MELQTRRGVKTPLTRKAPREGVQLVGVAIGHALGFALCDEAFEGRVR